MRYHFTATPDSTIDGDIIVDGVLVPFANLQVWSDELLAHYGITRQSDPAAPPMSLVPQEVSPRQLRLALNAAGLLAAVEQAVTGSTDEVLKIEWNYATTFRRSHPSVLAMAAALNKSDDDMDKLFILASSFT